MDNEKWNIRRNRRNGTVRWTQEMPMYAFVGRDSERVCRELGVRVISDAEWLSGDVAAGIVGRSVLATDRYVMWIRFKGGEELFHPDRIAVLAGKPLFERLLKELRK